MLTCVVCSLENQKCSRHFPFPTPVPACGPGGGAEEAPCPAGETKAAWAVRPGPRRSPGAVAGLPQAGRSPRTPPPAASPRGWSLVSAGPPGSVGRAPVLLRRLK